MASLNVAGSTLRYKRLLMVIKQTAFEEYSQLKRRGQAPKALRWKRLENRYQSHKKCVNSLITILKRNDVDLTCVNRVELDRQHLEDVDLMLSVGGDGTVLSSAHFLDHGTIPLLGINSDPNITLADVQVKKKVVDERRSHGALCYTSPISMADDLPRILHGDADDALGMRKRIRCKVKSTFSETRLVPALNDLLIANPSPAAVSRFRLGWLGEADQHGAQVPKSHYGTVTRFGGTAYSVQHSLNVWSSGMWVCTSTGSTAAMAAAGGKVMQLDDPDLQYLIREHMMENSNEDVDSTVDNRFFNQGKMHLRWNSHKGRIFIDGSHLSHNIELGDEIMIDNDAPPLQIFLHDNKTRPAVA